MLKYDFPVLARDYKRMADLHIFLHSFTIQKYLTPVID